MGSENEADATRKPRDDDCTDRKTAHDLDVQDELTCRFRECNVGCITTKVMADIRCSPKTSSSKLGAREPATDRNKEPVHITSKKV